MSLTNSLPVLEEFVSIQGEGRNIGIPYYFIRVGGCPLRCNFCDSEYTWKMKKESLKSLDAIVQDAIIRCKDFGINWVSITGGEPLLYPEALSNVMIKLRMAGLSTHIETSGRFFDESCFELSSIWSPDCKTPSTGEQMDGYFKGLELMRNQDQVKCLIGSEMDFDYANKMNEKLAYRCETILQPFNTNILTNSTMNMSAMQADSRVAETPSISEIRYNLGSSLRWLIDTFKSRCQKGEVWRKVRITPQIHVSAYGNKPGI